MLNYLALAHLGDMTHIFLYVDPECICLNARTVRELV